MNDLQRYFESNQGRLIHKWTHYFDIYDRHFSRFRNTDVHILEIGIYHGGSLQIWRDYFGLQAKIIGIDIDPRCQEFAEEGTDILIGSQEDREFLAQVRAQYPRIDILLDDGGHTMRQQIATFEELVLMLNKHPEADMIYSDEDKIDEKNQRKFPFFKPDWCPDSFLSRMYTCHLGVYRRSLITEIGGFRVGFEGSQDYDLVLRFTEKTDRIFHIPKVLYHWRIHEESTLHDASELLAEDAGTGKVNGVEPGIDPSNNPNGDA